MDELFHQIDQFVLDRLSEGKLPGLSLAIVKDNKVIYTRGYGFSDVSNARQALSDTLYCIGSITKSFTALAIMQLVEAGKLSLKDPVDNYLDYVPDVFEKNVTIHHLLTHSSGVPALGYAEAFIRGLVGLDDKWLPVTQPIDVMTFIDGANDWREAEPGEKFFYLNEGYVALGMIISRVSGMPYDVYIKKNILEPLGMNRTYMAPEDIERDGGLAKPYILGENGEFQEAGFPYGIYADGGIVSNVLDMAKYLMMYINKGRTNGKKIVDEKSVEMMETPYIELPYKVLGKEAYGYGLKVTQDFYGFKLVDHSGSILVHTGYMGYVRDKGVGVVLLANGSGYPLSFIGQYILAMLIDEDPEELPFIWKDKVLRKLEGTYQLYKGTVKADVEKRGSLLYLIMKEGARKIETPLFPLKLSYGYAIFKTISYWREYTVEFRVKEGSVEFIYERYKFRKI